MTTKILFLSADPNNATRLRLDQELRDITEKLRLAKLRNKFKLEARTAVRPGDISQAILDVMPNIVHFSGHGTNMGELCFEDELGKIKPVTTKALAALFKLVDEPVNCVILNACYSASQAKAIAKHISYVVGMKKAIGDKAAIAFAVGFYKALGAGRSVEQAYKFACVEIQLESCEEHLLPVLLTKKELKNQGHRDNSKKFAPETTDSKSSTIATKRKRGNLQPKPRNERSLKASSSKTSSTEIIKSASLTTSEPSRKKPNPPSITKTQQAQKSSSTVKKQTLTNSKSTGLARKSISSSGAWVLLDNNCFLTKSVETQTDRTTIIHILPSTSEQEVALHNLQPEQYYKKPISYAYKNEAARMQVESIHQKSQQGKTEFIITLKPYPQGQGNSIMEVSFYGYTLDKIAELRARFLLLNQLPPADRSEHEYSMFISLIKGYDNPEEAKKCVFIDLWIKWKNNPQLFLTHARLAAVYYLKMTRTVEHILELKLTLLKKDTISVRFRGQRKKQPSYSPQEPAIIEIKDNCILKFEV